MAGNFEKLNDSNWGQWRMLMKALLVKKNVWEVVDGSETLPTGSPNSKPVCAFRRKQAEALAEITLHVGLPQLSFIRDDDPAIVWNALATVHQARGMATRLALRRSFLRLQKTDGPMQNFISEARRIALQLTEIGIAVDDEDIILVLTGGLPSTYENFVITLDSTPTSQLTLDYVISRLLNEEARQAATSRSELEHPEAALAAACRPKRDVSQITCWNCGKLGHYQSSCSEPKRETVHIAVEGGNYTY